MVGCFPMVKSTMGKWCFCSDEHFFQKETKPDVFIKKLSMRYFREILSIILNKIFPDS